MNYFVTALVAVLLTWALPAQAHPHIFIRYNVSIAPGEPGFINLHFVFKVRQIVSPFSALQDKQLIDKNMIVNLEHHPVYFYLDVDTESIGRQPVRLIPAKSHDDEKSYTFELAIPKPSEGFGFSLYDPDYFSSVVLDGPNALLIKENVIKCSTQTRVITKTMWGDLQAQYIECGEKSQLRPRGMKDKVPATPKSSDDDGLHGQDMLP